MVASKGVLSTLHSQASQPMEAGTTSGSSRPNASVREEAGDEIAAAQGEIKADHRQGQVGGRKKQDGFDILGRGSRSPGKGG